MPYADDEAEADDTDDEEDEEEGEEEEEGARPAGAQPPEAIVLKMYQDVPRYTRRSQDDWNPEMSQDVLGRPRVCARGGC